MTLLASEAARGWPPATVHWHDGHFVLSARSHPGLEVRRDGQLLDDGLYPLTAGDSFVLGATSLSLEVKEERWPVDLARESALLTASDADWKVYADQLLSVGDPLGTCLVDPSLRAFDISLGVEVQPLIAGRTLYCTPGLRGLWRGLRFIDYPGAELSSEGRFAAVLGHPMAWFAQAITVVFKTPDRDVDLVALQRRVADTTAFIGRYAGPFVVNVVFPGLDAAVLVQAPRAGMRVSRSGSSSRATP